MEHYIVFSSISAPFLCHLSSTPAGPAAPAGAAPPAVAAGAWNTSSASVATVGTKDGDVVGTKPWGIQRCQRPKIVIHSDLK